MVHPKPDSDERAALYGYLCGRAVNASKLPALTQDLERFKISKGEVPRVPFQMLTALELGEAEWVQIARTASWTMTRMNLNTFARHGVFGVKGMTRQIAERLRNPELVKKARVFPYQILSAYLSTAKDVPVEVREALQDAMEHALENVPRIEGKVHILVDVSGSMSSPITGHRAGATTSVRCIQVAALFAAAMLRTNREAEVLPFAEGVRHVQLNPRDSVMSLTEKLASMGGGGTNCSAALAELNRRKAKGALVVLVSDNESWMDAARGKGTATLEQWEAFRMRNRNAKLCCIDLQPNAHTQAAERADILNVGGFSDHVFEMVGAFVNDELHPAHWVAAINEVQL